MSEDTWIYAFKEAELKDGEKKALVIDGQKIALIKKSNDYLLSPINVCIWSALYPKVNWKVISSNVHAMTGDLISAAVSSLTQRSSRSLSTN
jgi:hypothetical protein